MSQQFLDCVRKVLELNGYLQYQPPPRCLKSPQPSLLSVCSAAPDESLAIDLNLLYERLIVSPYPHVALDP